MNSITAISIGAAVAIVLVNFVLAYKSSQQALGKTGKDFLSAAIRGMGFRMIFMVIMVILAVSFVPVDLQTFGYALVAGLIVGLVVEIFLLKRVVDKMTGINSGEKVEPINNE